MKITILSVLASLLGQSAGHTIFQRVSVNGALQPQLAGVRAPASNFPIENLSDSAFACNKNIVHKDNTVITVPAGARVGTWWQHVIGGPQGANDPDNPIAASHKGPIIVYLAKVSNAASSGTTGLQWFKVAQAGLSGGRWAVDTMIANNGWHYFDMPTCVAPGDYLMRVELIALHNAYTSPGAQFYMECAQIRITGSGTNTGSNFASFPGAYTSSHPGVSINIYGNVQSYTIPGPALLTCSGSSNPPPPASSTSSSASAPAPTGGAGAPLYGQCGGIGWTGATTCTQGTCKVSSEYYSQCLM